MASRMFALAAASVSPAEAQPAGEVGAHGREVTGLGITFQNDSERHIHDILTAPAKLRSDRPDPACSAHDAVTVVSRE
jgi:hypothetical protein